MEVLKKSFDDFKKRQEAENYRVCAPHPGHPVPNLFVLPVLQVPVESVCLILAVVGIRPEKTDLEEALMELQEEDIEQVSGVPVHVDLQDALMEEDIE